MGGAFGCLLGAGLGKGVKVQVFTIVARSRNCEVLLDKHGFYVRCTACPYVSEYTPAKYVARQWADAHDEDQPNDGHMS